MPLCGLLFALALAIGDSALTDKIQDAVAKFLQDGEGDTCSVQQSVAAAQDAALQGGAIVLAFASYSMDTNSPGKFNAST